MTTYHLHHPLTGEIIVVDRMTRREATKRNESLEIMRMPYRWLLSPSLSPIQTQSQKAA